MTSQSTRASGTDRALEGAAAPRTSSTDQATDQAVWRRMVLVPGPDDHVGHSSPARAVVVVADHGTTSDPPVEGLKELVAAELEAAEPRAAVATVEGSVVALIPDHVGADDVEAVGRAIVDEARSGLELSSVMVGIGRAHAGEEGIPRTCREALWAATAGELLWGPNRVATFEALGIYGMLEPLVAEPNPADTADIQRLLDHDRHSGSALVPTLETFFRTCSVSRTAAEMFVHRNTVSYRLRAVQRITGMDVLGDPDAKVHLDVQLRVARLRRLL